MMTATAATLTDSQQALIDARLDTIDRMLLGHVARTDRITIVSEVEAQIQELLSAREGQEASREDVIEALRRLDPPEAYMPEATYPGELPHTTRFAPPTTAAAATSRGSQHGRIGGILGLSFCGLLLVAPPLIWLITMALGGSVLIFFGLIGAALLIGLPGSITALVLSIYGRRHGVLPIIGIVTGAFALPFWFAGGVYLMVCFAAG